MISIRISAVLLALAAIVCVPVSAQAPNKAAPAPAHSPAPAASPAPVAQPPVAFQNLNKEVITIPMPLVDFAAAYEKIK